jgi:hypothetical protein
LLRVVDTLRKPAASLGQSVKKGRVFPQKLVIMAIRRNRILGAHECKGLNEGCVSEQDRTLVDNRANKEIPMR